LSVRRSVDSKDDIRVKLEATVLQMRSVTELIDAMHDLEEGDSVTVETEDERYHGPVTRSEYDAPQGDDTGTLRVLIRVEGRDAPERCELRTAASASQKFPRPELYTDPSDDTESDPLGAVADITVDASDT
jgi:hypothetical protein